MSYRLSFKTSGINTIKRKIRAWLRNENQFFYLDSCNFYDHNEDNSYNRYNSYELLIGVGKKDILQAKSGNAFKALKQFREKNKNEWLFGILTYDLKNEVENLFSKNNTQFLFPDLYFIIPKIVIALEKDEIIFYGQNKDQLKRTWKEIYEQKPLFNSTTLPEVKFKSNFELEEYKDVVQKIRNHIVEGDIYELNFCQEFSGKADFDPFILFEKIIETSPSPFSSFVRIYDKYVLSATMERFLKKEGSKLIAQPIKGTIKRGTNKVEDDKLASELKNSQKDRAENVMIVDLMRNDLARSSVPGSTQVEELFKVYSFPAVHQMISTVTSEIKSDLHFLDALKKAFPMGSMTGAPKIRAMELIEKYERSKRSVFSGSIGYISPGEDFDFNVVIRTFIYDQTSSDLSIHVGSAITYDSDPEKEYEECLVKIKKLIELFGM